MKKISTQESKQIMMQILTEVASFCDDNGMTYFLTYGSLLGAIRHKGFIPWDDDIDIAMPRPDYERFVELYHQKGRYAISSPLVDKDCYLVYSKVFDVRTENYEDGIDYSRYKPLGIDIDVFPLDGIPDDKHRRSYLFWQYVRYLLGMALLRSTSPLTNYYKTTKGKYFGPLVRIFCRLINKNFYIRCYLKVAKKYKYEECAYVHVAYPSKESIHTKHAKKIFSKRIKVPFEDTEFWVPVGYDEYLTGLYHDYMQLPPEDMRKAPHERNIYWKES